MTTLAFGGLTVLPAQAEKPAVENANTAGVSAYVVQTSGKGWGLTSKVGSTLSKQEGVDKVLLSGLRGTVIMKDGASLDQAKVKADLKKSGLGLASFSKEVIPMPTSVFKLDVSGIGWAETNDKARAALEKVAGISGAYINKGIILHYTDNSEFDKAKVESVLSKYKIKIKSSSAVTGNPFG